MYFMRLTNVYGAVVSVNMRHVVYVQRDETQDCTDVKLVDGVLLHVKESVQHIVEAMER
jgi:hypothetical protein